MTTLTDTTSTLAKLTPGTWTIDPSHSSVSFVVRHMMVSKVRGSFHDFHADVTIAPDPLQSKVHAEVNMKSIDEGPLVLVLLHVARSTISS